MVRIIKGVKVISAEIEVWTATPCANWWTAFARSSAPEWSSWAPPKTAKLLYWQELRGSDLPAGTPARSSRPQLRK